MKLSDYIVKFLESKSVRHIFLLSGGGIMHLLDSVGKSESIQYVCNLHEQACSYAAEAYGQVTHDMGVALVTTGPGGTNALSGVAAAWADSTPLLILSGQVKRSDSAVPRKVRQYGLQENNIVEMVKSITKYAVCIDNPQEIRYHLEKAWFLAQNGRKGPVWIDVPLDVQAAQIMPDNLSGFSPEVPKDIDNTANIKDFIHLLERAKRPLFFLGHGVMADLSADGYVVLSEKLNIPILTSWRAKAAIDYAHPLFFGHPGSPAHRCANFILQSCDLLIVVGSRLSPGVTAYNEGGFGCNAKRVIVDIDRHELDKMSTDFSLKLCMSAGEFLKQLSTATVNINDYKPWIAHCRAMREKYPVLQEYSTWTLPGVNPYVLMAEISKRMTASDNMVAASAGQFCTASHLLYDYKKGQSFFNSMGLGAMGYSLPAAIGVCFASNRRRTFAFDGDGSLQLNVQELQTLNNYSLPVKLFVLNNAAYASIVSTQKHNFQSRFTGANAESGVVLPNLELVAKAYGIAYFRISENAQAQEVLNQMLAHDGPCLCDVTVSEDMNEFPRTMTHIAEDGTITSDMLENLWPYLPAEEVAENIIALESGF